MSKLFNAANSYDLRVVEIVLLHQLFAGEQQVGDDFDAGVDSPHLVQPSMIGLKKKTNCMTFKLTLRLLQTSANLMQPASNTVCCSKKRVFSN